jgi:Protein of unknown function (DUF3995)
MARIVVQILAVAAALIFLALGLIHVAWAFGAALGTGAVIPTRADGSAVLAPRRWGTLAVAVLLWAAGFVLLERAGLGPGVLPPAWRRVGAVGVTIVLALRGVGDFRYVGLFRVERSTRFARLDRLIFTPLVWSLAALATVVAYLG